MASSSSSSSPCSLRPGGLDDSDHVVSHREPHEPSLRKRTLPRWRPRAREVDACTTGSRASRNPRRRRRPRADRWRYFRVDGRRPHRRRAARADAAGRRRTISPRLRHGRPCGRHGASAIAPQMRKAREVQGPGAKMGVLGRLGHHGQMGIFPEDSVDATLAQSSPRRWRPLLHATPATDVAGHLPLATSKPTRRPRLDDDAVLAS